MKKYIILLITILFVSSCGSRKVLINKEEVKTEVTANATEIEKKDSIKDSLVVSNIEVCDIEITPIDSTKEFIVNGKKYFNARISIKRKKDNTIYQKKEIVSETKEKTQKITIKKDEKLTEKKVDKKEATSHLFWIFILIILLALALRIVIKKVLE
jgi:hypothetical protein